MNHVSWIGVALALLAYGAAPASAQRLSTTVVPDHYDLNFAPDLADASFAGDATIHVRVADPVTAVTLHAVDLKIHEVTITAAGLTQTASASADATRETVTLAVPRPLAAGPASIHIRYTGRLNDRLRGFYISRANGRTYAVTQLEATDARRAFPSFDEPAFKATFTIAITVDRGDTAISNGRLVSDTAGPGENRHTLRFSRSPRMSTYLVAMAVGDFECLSADADGIPIRVCATPDKVHLGQFALEAAQYTMQWLNAYFSIRYPFEKLDILAVPDFAAGAMENTGAIFYRESLLTIDETRVSIEVRRNVAAVLAHEIAHHWFGNLVTMRWWDDIWLNEGFATWMESKPVQTWQPSWRADLVEARDTQRALTLDELQSTRAIRTRVSTPEEINELFDAITYEKSAAVLRMVEALVGPDVFQAGVNAYLEKHAYGNAAAEDFWTEIAAASGRPVDRIMASFVDQKGSPLVQATAACVDQTLQVTLTQQPFFVDSPRAGPGAVDREAWWQTPVCAQWPTATGALERSCRLLTGPVQTWEIDACPAWIHANAGGLGAYRTAYEPGMLSRLALAAEATLTPVERISLLGDEWALVREGRDTIAQYLTIAERLAGDRSGPVVELLTGRIDYVSEYLVPADRRQAFQAWVRRILMPAARELGWRATPGESLDEQTRRARVLYTLGSAGVDPEARRAAREIVTAYLEGDSTTDPALLSTAIRLAAMDGDAALYDRMAARLRRETEPTEQQRWRGALAQFADATLVARTIDLAFSDDVRTQDVPTLLAALLSNPDARAPTWEAIKARWGSLEQRLGVFLGLPRVVGATAAFCDAQAREDVRRFFESHKIPSADRALRQSLDRIDACVALEARAQEPLRGFFANQQ